MRKPDPTATAGIIDDPALGAGVRPLDPLGRTRRSRKAREATLSTRMRDETDIAHRLAEGTRLAAAFFAGRLRTEHYVRALQAIGPVYTAIEEGLDAHRHVPLVEAARFPQLFRAPAIRHDLAALEAPVLEPRPGSAARAYSERVREVSDAAPHLLVAHAYTRYLGDLSGGRIAARVARWALGLHDGDSLTFFHYEGVEPAPMRRTFKRAIDAVPLETEQVDAIVEETRRAFLLHRDLADELFDAW